MHIDKHVFIVTGAGSGLGAATARMLVEAGGRVILVDINAETAEALAAELGETAGVAVADISREEDAAAAIQVTRERFGAVHGLANCAGILNAEKVLGREGPHRLDSFARTINVNLIGSFNMLRLAAQAMADNAPDGEGERGVIINTASIAAYDGQMGQTAYAASKGGIASLTLPAARDLARYGIRVMTVAPGIFETPMMSELPQEAHDALCANVPFPSRLGRPGEYAALVRHIIENPMLNGEVIRLDGALRMAAK
ncbi:SDR family NAD(P)-dependent oxidoreductase [Halomonas shantousis]